MPTDRDSGRARGFAFVQMATGDEATAAKERLNGHELNGRAIRVDEATEKPARSMGGGSGESHGPRGAFAPGPRSRPKGSRRNLRARKRSL